MQGAGAGVAGELAGDVPQPVAQALGLGDGVLAVEQQRLGPGGQGVSGQRELKPRLVGVKVAERQLGKTGVLEFADAVFDAGVLTMAGLQCGDVA